MEISIKKDLASNWFKLLQNAICDDILKIEKNKVNFESTTWKRSNKKDEGGGEFRILKNGKIFEKVGVNFSKVYGKFPKQFQKNIPGASKDPRFWASGISIVMHMQNPHIPAMHFNTRFICTTKNWFGGGMDVTPAIKGRQAVIDIINFKIFTSNKVEKKLIKLLDTYKERVIPTLPIGADLLMSKFQISEGKTLGKKLKRIEETWVQNGFQISDKQVQQIVKS